MAELEKVVKKAAFHINKCSEFGNKRELSDGKRAIKLARQIYR